MTECYDWYIPQPPPRKDDTIKVGDKVEIVDAWDIDRVIGIKKGDVAKVTFVGGDHVCCTNPKWNLVSHKVGRIMSKGQIKLIQKPREELL